MRTPGQRPRGWVAAWIVAVSLAAGLVAPAFAQAPGAGSATPQTGAGSGTPLGKKVLARRVSGTGDTLVLGTLDANKQEKEWTFLLDPTTRIRKADKLVAAKDLAEKDTVRVAYQDVGGTLHATLIVVTGKKKT